jgi:hypothetical protein
MDPHARAHLRYRHPPAGHASYAASLMAE